MDYLQKIILDIEIQSLSGIKECFDNGLDPNTILNGRPLIYELVNEYPRGPLFKEIVKLFIAYGLDFEDKALLAVLADDPIVLKKVLTDQPGWIQNTYTLTCTFTPLYKASLLHICAEYNHVEAAKILLQHGADVNVKAGLDEHGFGGQTPIFHTVNQHANCCKEMMHWLISQGADLQITVKGLIWGKSYEWETFIPAVNPISYSMMGLLRQFQRKEEWIYENTKALLQAAYGIDYTPTNLPNAYLVRG